MKGVVPQKRSPPDVSFCSGYDQRQIPLVQIFEWGLEDQVGFETLGADRRVSALIPQTG